MMMHHRTNLLYFVNAQKRGYLSNKKVVSLCDYLNRIKLCYSTASNQQPSERMTETLKRKFPLAKQIEVVDVSGGCGSMYEIFVESIEFKGLSIVKQHRLINEILKDDIKQMHGLRISTKVPAENS